MIDNAGKYTTIKGSCYYFTTKNTRDFMSSASNCKTKFNGNGRLFEPMDNKTSDTYVFKYAQKLRLNLEEKLSWIGVRTQVHETKRVFYYLSKGPTTALAYDNAWDVSEPDNGSGNEDCVSILQFNQLGWADDRCDVKGYSICELEKIEGKQSASSDLRLDH